VIVGFCAACKTRPCTQQNRCAHCRRLVCPKCSEGHEQRPRPELPDDDAGGELLGLGDDTVLGPWGPIVLRP